MKQTLIKTRQQQYRKSKFFLKKTVLLKKKAKLVKICQQTWIFYDLKIKLSLN